MKTVKILAASVLLAPFASAATIIPFDFTNVAPVAGSPTTWSTAGDVWRATGANTDLGIDAIFTITGTAAGAGAIPTNLVAFVTEPARGNNMRVRVGVESPFVTDARVFITIQFVDSVTSDPFVSWAADSQLIAQFSDIDSDVGFDRSDFGGVRQGTYDQAFSSDDVNPGSSLLVMDTITYGSNNYDIFVMEEPWEPQDNVTDTSAAAQSPVTGAFLFDTSSLGTSSEIFVTVGQLSNDDVGNRHIDIDMTPDFIIIPEPSSALLVALAGLFGFMRRRR